MKISFLMLIIFFLTGNVFAQNAELLDSIKTLKKSLEKYAIASPLTKHTTGFKAKDFDSCEVIFKFENYSGYASVNDLPINGPGNNPTVSASNQMNPVFVRDRADSTVVYRTDGQNRNIRVGNSYISNFNTKQNNILNFIEIDSDSFRVEKEPSKNVFVLYFSNKTKDNSNKNVNFVGQKNYQLFLKTKTLSASNEVLEKFKKVVSLCQTK